MFRHSRRKMVCFYALVVAGGLAGGAVRSSPCDGDYCGGTLSNGCSGPIATQLHVCCKDFDGDEVKHCIKCARDVYYCPGVVFQMGAPYNCHDPGDVCQ